MVTEKENKNKSVVKKSTKKRATKKSPSVSKKKITSIEKQIVQSAEFVSIAKSVGTASVIMTALIVAVTPGSVWVAGPVVGAMCIFGVAMGYFASK